MGDAAGIVTDSLASAHSQQTSAAPARSRSVVDYDSEDALRKALLSVDLDGNSSDTGSAAMLAEEEDAASKDGVDFDWVLKNYDQEGSEVQSMKEELQRLQVLKSYLLLDCDCERVFDRVTDLASRIFDVPVSLISLIDIGRAWVLANVGVDESIRDRPRRISFCSHTVLAKSSTMIVPDASKDVRFRDNPYVAVEGGIRFYAGASLLSPEGYKLGAICVVDSKPWPQGITESQARILTALAEIVVEAMASRRKKLQAQDSSPAEIIACTSHDLLTPLSGVLLSLSLLKEDVDIRHKLDTQQFELLTTAASCSELMVRLCQSAIESLRADSAPPGSSSGTSMEMQLIADDNKSPVTKMDELVKSLQLIMEPIPKPVPLVIRLDPSVPQMVLCDDLKLFRSALNLLSSAVSRTKRGYINFKIFHKEDTSDLVFECEDTGDNIPVDQYAHLYRPCSPRDGDLRLCLSSVGRTIGSLGGCVGFHPRSQAGHIGNGSIFWFSVPLKMTQDPNESSKKMYARRDPVVPQVRQDSVAASIAMPEGRALPLFDNCVSVTSSSSSSFSKVGEKPTALSKFHEPPCPMQISVEEPEQSRVMHVDKPLETPLVPAVPVAPTTTVPVELPHGPRKHRALVVDDSLVVRKSLGMALKKLGFDASLAVDGLEGLNLMKQTMFDLVLCDFLMPVMDGLDCVKQYRDWESAFRPGFRQLIIGISAHADADVADQGLAAGMDGFHAKPVGIKILKELRESDAVREASRQLDEFEGAVKTPLVENDADDSQSNVRHKRGAPSEPLTRYSEKDSHKRPRSDREWQSSQPYCLIATDRPKTTISGLVELMESHGWKAAVVHDSNNALQSLQMRNWDAVMVHDELPALPGGESCVRKFREWERKNRVNLQKNMWLLTDLTIPSPHDSTAVVQAPVGFDRVLHTLLSWDELKHLLDRNSNDSTMTIVMNKR